MNIYRHQGTEAVGTKKATEPEINIKMGYRY
jgi:hypothetical protein